MVNSVLQAEAEAALEAGVAVASISTPGTTNGVFLIDDDAQRKLLGTFAYTVAFSAFPAGKAAWVIRDINGIPRTFASVAQFQAFCRVVTDYVAELYLIIDEIDTASKVLPATPLSIP